MNYDKYLNYEKPTKKNIFFIFKISTHDNKIVLLNVNKNFKYCTNNK